MSFNFEMLREKFREYHKTYKELYKKIENKKRSLKLKTFSPKYNECLHSVYAADGSFINYWKSPLEELYLGGIRIGFIEQTYQYYPKQTYIENCGAMDDFVFMRFKNSKSQPRNVLSYVMGKRERQKLYEFALQSENQVIMIDGSLIEPLYMEKREKDEYREILGDDTFFDLQKHSTMRDLIDICRKNDHILVGVVKDSRAIKLEGLLRYEVVLEKLSLHDPHKLYYFEVPEEHFSYLKRNKNDGLISIFAKLHKKAMKWHRIDLLVSHHSLEDDILPTLANYSLYNRHLGTPHAPQVCDAIAVEIRQRKQKVMREIYKILIETGFNVTDALFGSTDVNGESMIFLHSAHAFYDQNRKAIRFINDDGE